MSPKTPGAPTKTNYSLAILWLASVVVGLVGYVLMTSSNSGQAELYTTQKADYAHLFTLQSGSSLGATLIGLGVLGLLIALATHAVSFAIARSAAAAATPVVTEEDFVETDADSENTVVSAPAMGAPAVPVPTQAAPIADAPAVVFDAPETPASAAETATVDAPAPADDETPSAPTEGDAKA